MTRVLVVDNYDSFAYNLVQFVGEFADEVVVRRNDAVDVDGVRDLHPDGVVVSPGPGTPDDAGVSKAVFADLSYPTLGVCLGHQALCAVHGATVAHAPSVVHGKSSVVRHDGAGVFAGLPETFAVGRYHSLGVRRDDVPPCLVETARVAGGDGRANDAGDDRVVDGEPSAGLVMGVRHRTRPHVGVQFHPESILTDRGRALVRNFVAACDTGVDGGFDADDRAMRADECADACDHGRA